MTHLTSNEIAALKTCLNYNTRDEQLDDNYSCGGIIEFAAELKWTKAQAKGLASSLTQKGMGYMDEEDDIFWLTEDGVNAIFDIIDEENAK